MTTRSMMPTLVLLTLSFVFGLSPVAEAGGPPMISIARAEAGSREARAGAAYVLHVDRCGVPKSSDVLARAEGIVRGERRSVPLSVIPTAREGAFLVKPEWPAEGTWTLVFSVNDHGHSTLFARHATSGPLETRLVHAKPSAADIDAAVRGTVAVAGKS